VAATRGPTAIVGKMQIGEAAPCSDQASGDCDILGASAARLLIAGYAGSSSIQMRAPISSLRSW
jgi:hypothetical protein